jgi:AraC-like DNA-binding protein
LGQKLRAADIAALTHLSESQFRARCQEELGMTPMQWIRSLRLDKAVQLREAGLKMSEVAARVGYETPSALTAALGKHLPR